MASLRQQAVTAIEQAQERPSPGHQAGWNFEKPSLEGRVFAYRRGVRAR